MVEYTIKDRQTGEILCQGTQKECADYIGCGVKYLVELGRTQPEYKTPSKSKYAKYKVERQVFGETKRGGSRRKDVTCLDCGVLMQDVSATRKRCPECAKKYRHEQNRNHMREVRNSSPWRQSIPNKNRTGCEGCVYYGGDYFQCCNYIFIKNKRRPCPPGKGCTVKEMRKVRRRNAPG